MAGYSSTPLHKKLGLKPNMRLLLVGMPKEYREWIADAPSGVELVTVLEAPVEAAHLFCTDSGLLHDQLASLRLILSPSGFIWVSWPKKASRVPTDITEDLIRDIALPMGYVDIKVCAVSDVWSGLKLVIRKTERQPAAPAT